MRLQMLLLLICPSVMSEYENVFTTLVDNSVLLDSMPEDFKTNITAKAHKYGYHSEEHLIKTDDGYLLSIFRLSTLGNTAGKPLIVMHGILDTSDTWFLRGKNSIGFLLADAGYDVWFGNCRGNRYGRQHAYLQPDRHGEFWNYTYHDIGFHDMAATVDYVLKITGEKSLKVLAQSQGTTVFYVLLSTRAEYNTKIDVVISLAPISYVHNASGPLVPVIIALITTFNELLNLFGQHELMADRSIPTVILQYICHYNPKVCAENIFFPLAGASTQQIEIDFYKYIVAKYPSATTRKNFLHLSQNRIQKRFAMFDYGFSRNTQIYGSKRSPSYDLSRITTRVGLICSKNDGLSSLKDVALLREQLPNVIKYHLIENEEWTHADFLWGRGIKKVVMPAVLEILNST